jgi:hypothetical protein
MAEGRASYEEAALYKEILDYLAPENVTLSASDYQSLLPKYEEGARNLFEKYPKSWMVGIIERHDESHGTDFAKQYRELASKLMSLFVSAEGNTNPHKTSLAAHVERALEPEAPAWLSTGENRAAAEQIIADVRKVLSVATQPLSVVLRELNGGNADSMTPEQYIFHEIRDTLVRFSECDGAIADPEAELCLDVLRMLQPSMYSAWDVNSLRQFAATTERSIEPNLFVLQALSLFDRASNTTHATMVHSALWRIANFVVKADGTVKDFAELFEEKLLEGKQSNLNSDLKVYVKTYPYVLYAFDGLRHVSDTLRETPNLIVGAGPNDAARRFLLRVLPDETR